ncbi:hypothetical protein RHMOL_Rhmol11G0195700 [Rhododendron molle]|uniref:Uncharacterized protein n=1 Tax=Rhododendron molle TaxID=49168 RepID=A0ACC0LU87_RHOML|nr:hypothetical protein RHMOL_Rhmol11G0195700 [Rhododendron molle]
MMKKKIMVLSLVLLFIISLSHMEGVESQGIDCYDGCNTGCVGLSRKYTLSSILSFNL